MLKVIQKLWALTPKQIRNRSFKWGTKHWFWSRGFKDTRGQSWSSEKISANSADTGHMGSNQADIPFNLQLWPLISLQPLDQNQCLVLYLKDLLHICLETKAQGFWVTFKVSNLGSKYSSWAYVIFFFRTLCVGQHHYVKNDIYFWDRGWVGILDPLKISWLLPSSSYFLTLISEFATQTRYSFLPLIASKLRHPSEFLELSCAFLLF